MSRLRARRAASFSCLLPRDGARCARRRAVLQAAPPGATAPTRRGQAPSVLRRTALDVRVRGSRSRFAFESPHFTRGVAAQRREVVLELSVFLGKLSELRLSNSFARPPRPFFPPPPLEERYLLSERTIFLLQIRCTSLSSSKSLHRYVLLRLSLTQSLQRQSLPGADYSPAARAQPINGALQGFRRWAWTYARGDICARSNSAA